MYISHSPDMWFLLWQGHFLGIWFKRVFHNQVDSPCTKAASTNNHNRQRLQGDLDCVVWYLVWLLYFQDSCPLLIVSLNALGDFPKHAIITSINVNKQYVHIHRQRKVKKNPLGFSLLKWSKMGLFEYLVLNYNLSSTLWVT